MHDCYAPEKRLYDRTEILLHERPGTCLGRVDEEQDTVVNRQLTKSIIQQGTASERKHLGILIGVGRWDVTLHHGDIDATRWYDRSWR